MKLETKFSCGDTVYVFSAGCTKENPGFARQMTIGRVQISHTGRLTASGGVLYRGNKVFEPDLRPEFEESYMCVETGIGTGSIWTLENIFRTAEEALASGAERMEAIRQGWIKQERGQRQDLIRREESVRRELAKIEKAKAEVLAEENDSSALQIL